MIGYKDKTWCPYNDCEAFSVCERALTEQIRKDAKKWWGGSNRVPIMQFAERPQCFAISIGELKPINT